MLAEPTICSRWFTPSVWQYAVEVNSAGVPTAIQPRYTERSPDGRVNAPLSAMAEGGVAEYKCSEKEVIPAGMAEICGIRSTSAIMIRCAEVIPVAIVS